MSAAGWYPDPGGTPGQYRYWDGRTWSSTTSPVPGGPAPTPGTPRRGRGLWIILGIIAAVLVAALVTWIVVGNRPTIITEDSNSASPSVTSWNEQQTSTPTPVEVPEGGTLVKCPNGNTTPTNTYPNDGWLHGGGLKVKEIPGWKREQVYMGWVYDMSTQTSLVYTGGSHRWFSMSAVGALHTVDGFDQPKRSAFQVMSCFATSSYYSGYTGRSNLLSEAVTINGRPGWRLRSEVYVTMKDLPQVAGDVIDVIVVDTGDPESLGVYISSVTIDDNARLDLVEAAIKTLTTG